MNKNRLRSFLTIGIIIALLVIIPGCKSEKKTLTGTYATVAEETTKKVENKNWNAEDLSVILKIDKDKKEIALKSLNSKKEYSVIYTNGTSIQNRHGNELLIDEVLVGEIVDVYYMAGTQKLIALKESKSAWENTSVKKWNVDYDKKLITIGEEEYHYDDNLLIESGGKKLEIRQISGVDELIVKGIDRNIKSIIVSRGHGFIKLTDETNLIGGIVSVGTKIMTVITSDMVIVAPEGEFLLTASKNGVGGSVLVTVKKDDEVTVSLSGFVGEIVRNGAVKLNVTPEDSNPVLYLNGVKTDFSDILNLPYGNHKFEIKSDDYDTFTKIVTVDSAYRTINVDLSETETETDESETETAEETTVETETKKTTNKLIIKTPESASVYIDGNYVGKVPLETDKITGTHVILLRKTGYENMVYNVEFTDDSKDVTLTLPELTLSE